MVADVEALYKQSDAVWEVFTSKVNNSLAEWKGVCLLDLKG
jgi:hypothetical protein